jgi:DNA-directed RNA polymerase subunit RPC12/RpoP
MSDSDQKDQKATGPACPSCGHALTGDELKDLKCGGCGAELPPRIGI